MDKLEKKIGYAFRDRSLLQTALTHSSYSNERHGDGECYERLEFLGDSILGVVTAEFLYRRAPALPEGRMTRLRAELVCETSLHSVALELGLGAYMRLGKGEERTGGRERPSILADMVEAVIAALYLDSGMDEARRFIMEKLLRGDGGGTGTGAGKHVAEGVVLVDGGESPGRCYIRFDVAVAVVKGAIDPDGGSPGHGAFHVHGQQAARPRRLLGRLHGRGCEHLHQGGT